MKMTSLKNLKWKKRFTYLKNIVFNESDLNATGTKFQVVRFLPNTRIAPHYHNKVTEIFYILSGRGTFIFNGRKRKAKKDDIFLCEPKDTHEILNESSGELVILIFKTCESPSDIYFP